MFVIVVVVAVIVGGAPENMYQYTSRTTFESLQACEDARGTSVGGLLKDLENQIRDGGHTDTTVSAESECRGLSSSNSRADKLVDRSMDLLSETFRDMIRGGGFGTVR